MAKPKPKKPPRVRAKKKPSDVYRRRVLIVDDEPTSRRLLVKILSKDKYQIFQAGDGNQALEIAARDRPDVILLDIILPGCNGIEVTRRLKAEAKTKDIPVVFVTCMDGMINQLTGLEAGAEEYLAKPVNRVELLTRIQSMLQLKEYRDQLAIRRQAEGSSADGVQHEIPIAKPDLKLPVVLLVEDNEIDARVITSFLKEMPLRLETVSTGREAISRILAERIDLMLLDIMLPDMTGFDVCRHLKEVDPVQDTEIIIVSCLHDMESRLTSLELGIDDFLCKPIQRLELTARVRALLEKKFQRRDLLAHFRTVRESANLDAVTGVYNQGYFQRFLDLEIQRAISEGYPVGLLKLDIDDFGVYNRLRGQEAGDIILKELAQTLRGNARDVDLVSRCTEDEFAVVLPYADQQGVLRAARKIEQAILLSDFLKGLSSQMKILTCSIGAAAFPADAGTADELLQRADRRLSLAKQRGKNQVCFWGEKPFPKETARL